MHAEITRQMDLFTNDVSNEKPWNDGLHEEFNKLRSQLDDVMSEIDSMVWGRIQ